MNKFEMGGNAVPKPQEPETDEGTVDLGPDIAAHALRTESNDNRPVAESSAEQAARDIIEGLLSPSALKDYSQLWKCMTPEAFKARVDALNSYGKEQLNRDNSEVADELENESLASRQMNTVINVQVTPSIRYKLGVSRAMNGLFTFAVLKT